MPIPNFISRRNKRFVHRGKKNPSMAAPHLVLHHIRVLYQPGYSFCTAIYPNRHGEESERHLSLASLFSKIVIAMLTDNISQYKHDVVIAEDIFHDGVATSYQFYIDDVLWGNLVKIAFWAYEEHVRKNEERVTAALLDWKMPDLNDIYATQLAIDAITDCPKAVLV